MPQSSEAAAASRTTSLHVDDHPMEAAVASRTSSMHMDDHLMGTDIADEASAMNDDGALAMMADLRRDAAEYKQLFARALREGHALQGLGAARQSGTTEDDLTLWRQAKMERSQTFPSKHC